MSKTILRLSKFLRFFSVAWMYFAFGVIGLATGIQIYRAPTIGEGVYMATQKMSPFNFKYYAAVFLTMLPAICAARLSRFLDNKYKREK